MKKHAIVLFLMTALASFAVFAQGTQEEAAPAAAEASDAIPDNPVKGKTLSVGCSATFVPYESITMDANGNKTHIGMNIDVVKLIVEDHLGGKVNFVDMPFKGLIASIQSGQIDFCSGGMAPTAERAKTLDFTASFFWPRNAIVYRDTDNYPDLNSLKGKTVAYVFGTNYQKIAEQIPDVNAVGIQGSPACIEEVKSGRADACIIDGAGATEFLKQNKGLKLSLLDKNPEDCFAFGFPKGSPYFEAVNAELQKIMEDGELDAIVTKWLSEEFIL